MQNLIKNCIYVIYASPPINPLCINKIQPDFPIFSPDAPFSRRRPQVLSSAPSPAAGLNGRPSAKQESSCSIIISPAPTNEIDMFQGRTQSGKFRNTSITVVLLSLRGGCNYMHRIKLKLINQYIYIYAHWLYF